MIGIALLKKVFDDLDLNIRVIIYISCIIELGNNFTILCI